jgi:hypothetical protein
MPKRRPRLTGFTEAGEYMKGDKNLFFFYAGILVGTLGGILGNYLISVHFKYAEYVDVCGGDCISYWQNQFNITLIEIVIIIVAIMVLLYFSIPKSALQRGNKSTKEAASRGD